MTKGKSLLLIFLIPLFSFCTGKVSKAQDIPVADSISMSPLSYNDEEVDEKAIKIEIDSFTYSYSKEIFQLILDSFPQLQAKGKIVESPDTAYYKYPPYVKGWTFGSEAGEDEFYLLYAYFLRKKTRNKYKEERDNLINIYRNINGFFGTYYYGGTGFGHIYARIVGYAEYDAYCYPQESKKYRNDDFLRRKKTYIDSLKKIADKQLAEERIINGEETARERNETLHSEINELEQQIINGYYLAKAISFENSHNYKADL